jgi:ribosome biogenesis protein Nip4
MNDLENFRLINSYEKKIINSSLSVISTKILQILYDLQFSLYISFKHENSKTNYPKVFLLTVGQKEFLELSNFKNSVHFAGLYFGFIKKSNFLLSLEAAEFLYNEKLITKFQQLFLNKKGERSYLYGNNVLKKMAEKIPQKLKKQDFLLVFNNLNEIIGISRSLSDNQIIHTLKSGEVIATNLVDKGLYLRKVQ